MKNSPLQLDGYFFSHVEVRAHADADPAVDPRLRTVSELGKDEEGGRYLVTLRVEIGRAQDNTSPPYTGAVEVRGFFRVLEGYPPERRDEMIYVNGSTLLYGAAREMLLNITARGPWPGLLLPSVRFTNEDSEATPIPTPARQTAKVGSKPPVAPSARRKRKG